MMNNNNALQEDSDSDGELLTELFVRLSRFQIMTCIQSAEMTNTMQNYSYLDLRQKATDISLFPQCRQLACGFLSSVAINRFFPQQKLVVVFQIYLRFRYFRPYIDLEAHFYFPAFLCFRFSRHFRRVFYLCV